MSVEGDARPIVIHHEERDGPAPTLSSVQSRAWQFRNEYGEVRQGLVHDRLDLNDSEDVLLLEGVLYPEWVLADFGLALRRTVTTTAIHSGRSERRTEYHYVKARKRGNDVDAHRVDQRMRPLADVVLDYCEAAEPGRLPSRTRAVYVTGTVDPAAVDGDVNQAWRYLPRWFNGFLARLRKQFGTVLCEVGPGGKVRSRFVPCRIQGVRSWEAHESGWPHVHAILLFDDFRFRLFRDGRGVWRLKDKEAFAEAWGPGWIDVQGLTPGTAERGVENVLWYVSKGLSSMDYRLVDSWPRKRRLTQAILWYFGMRSFSVSRGFYESDDSALAADLTKRPCITQTGLDGQPAFVEYSRWEFLGLVRRDDTELTREDWTVVYDHPPDWLDKCWKPYSVRSGLGWTNAWGGA